MKANNMMDNLMLNENLNGGLFSMVIYYEAQWSILLQNVIITTYGKPDELFSTLTTIISFKFCNNYLQIWICK